jgi:hypothetical protein
MPVAMMNDHEKLALAAEGIRSFRSLDEHLMPLEDKLISSFGGIPSATGSHESDYPELRDRGLKLQFFREKKTYPIPEVVVNERKSK